MALPHMNLVPVGPDLKSEAEDTGLGGNTEVEGRVRHGMRGVVFLLFLAFAGVLFLIVAEMASSP